MAHDPGHDTDLEIDDDDNSSSGTGTCGYVQRVAGGTMARGLTTSAATCATWATQQLR